MKKPIFKGVATALYTPFCNNGIDFDNLERILRRQIKAKVNAVVLLGTTGEAPTVTRNERREMIKFAKSITKNELPLIVGTGTNNTALSVSLTREAEELGADGILAVTPYYNKCEQEGLFLHYKQIANSTTLPIICYNVPSRTGVNLLPETALELSTIDNIVGIKEASKDLNHIDKLFSTVSQKLHIYCGNDELNEYFFERNASGTISVASNIIPLKIKDIFENFKDYYKLEKEALTEFYTALFFKVNPIPVKAMAEILYGEKCVLRLPLTKANEKDYNYFIKVLNNISKEIFYD